MPFVEVFTHSTYLLVKCFYKREKGDFFFGEAWEIRIYYPFPQQLFPGLQISYWANLKKNISDVPNHGSCFVERHGRVGECIGLWSLNTAVFSLLSDTCLPLVKVLHPFVKEYAKQLKGKGNAHEMHPLLFCMALQSHPEVPDVMHTA